MKTTKKKLLLSKTTFRTLTGNDLRRVNGGDATIGTESIECSMATGDDPSSIQTRDSKCDGCVTQETTTVILPPKHCRSN